MTRTVGQLIDDANRLLGETGAGVALDPDTLAILFPIAREWLGGLAGHVTGTAASMFDQTVAAATTLYGGNVRLTCTTTCTVTLPAAPRDGWRIVVAYVVAGQVLTLGRNGKLIAGAASNATPATGAEYLYRADLADWRSPLVTALSDSVPWPDEFLRGLAAMLALELQPSIGLPVKMDTRALAASAERQMVERYHRRHPDLFRNWRYQSVPQVAA
jgi:hypothetical protein